MGTSPFDESNRLTVAGDTWRQGLIGISGEQVAAALRKCIARNDPWPPTLPEFRQMCFDIPTLTAVKRDVEARLLAKRDDGIGRFSLLVLQKLDGFRYARASEKEARAMLTEAYDEAVAHIMAGGELPEPPVAALVERAEYRRADPKTAGQHIREMRKALGMLTTFDDPERSKRIDAEKKRQLSEIRKRLQDDEAAKAQTL